MTSLREAFRRRLRTQTSDSSFDPRVSYRLYWTGQARTWAPARRAAVLRSIATLLQEPDFEPNTYHRRYRIDGLDSNGHAGASLVALRDVLTALDEHRCYGDDDWPSPERLERFRREAKALAALDHPGVVTVHSVEEAGGVHFLTMQVVEGQSLDRLIPEGGLPPGRILEIATALADALAGPQVGRQLGVGRGLFPGLG